MKNVKNCLLLLFITMSAATFAQEKNFYDFKVKTLEGQDFDFSSLKGKKVMIVNTASKCGNTPQYEQLESMYEQYRDKLVIVGFPANNFGSQEPGTNKEIREFCTKNYGVTFPMMQKISVKGSDMDPVYKWLTSKSLNGVMDSEVKWNFQKYLIDENGKLVAVIDPKEKPDSEKILSWLSK
ncbi:MAG TPA: glutathione peroxidase [Bacteroidales bacterium]|nr:glutathione peroxidase [Bacteroidales bacterium]